MQHLQRQGSSHIMYTQTDETGFSLQGEWRTALTAQSRSTTWHKMKEKLSEWYSSSTSPQVRSVLQCMEENKLINKVTVPRWCSRIIRDISTASMLHVIQNPTIWSVEQDNNSSYSIINIDVKNLCFKSVQYFLCKCLIIYFGWKCMFVQHKYRQGVKSFNNTPGSEWILLWSAAWCPTWYLTIK